MFSSVRSSTSFAILSFRRVFSAASDAFELVKPGTMLALKSKNKALGQLKPASKKDLRSCHCLGPHTLWSMQHAMTSNQPGSNAALLHGLHLVPA